MILREIITAEKERGGERRGEGASEASQLMTR